MRTVQQREALAKLRDLQGPPLAVLIAMHIVPRPVKKRELAAMLRRNEKTVSAAVDFLEQEGYITRQNYRAWALASGQLFLPGLDLLPSETRNGRKRGFETVKSTVSGTVRTTSTLISSPDIVVRSEAETVESTVSDEITEALAAIRIGGEAVSKQTWPTLAALAWVTPEYLTSMAAWVSDHSDHNKRTIGFFIHCVKSGDVVPEVKSVSERYATEGILT